MGKKPSFQFYHDDYIGGTMGFTIEQHGAYLLCLISQFKDGHLSEEKLNQVCGGRFDLIKSKFITDENGLYFNERMDEISLSSRLYKISRTINRDAKCQKCKNKTEIDNICISCVDHMLFICASHDDHMGDGDGDGIGIVLPRLEDKTEGVQREISDPIKVGIFYEVIANGPEKWKAEEIQGSQMWGRWTQEIPSNWKNQLPDIASKYKTYTDFRLARDKIDPMSLRNWLSSGEYMKNYPVATPEPKKVDEWEAFKQQARNLNRK